jgi:hypothetical protein
MKLLFQGYALHHCDRENDRENDRERGGGDSCWDRASSLPGASLSIVDKQEAKDKMALNIQQMQCSSVGLRVEW